MKILIDTNIYLDFYRYNNDHYSLLKFVIDNSDKIILTKQMVDEFFRNREGVISNVIKNFEQLNSLPNLPGSIFNNISSYKSFIKHKELYKLSKKLLINDIKDIKNNEAKDLVYLLFSDLVNKISTSKRLYPVTKVMVDRAYQRKLKGNPPRSLDKSSIGDEINWEIILENIDEDIIIVARDDTYKNNISFLRKEYFKAKGDKFLTHKETITEAFRDIGIDVSKSLIDYESELLEYFSQIVID